MNYYIGDLHFGHKNCLAFDNRPFKDTEEHDKALINNWNEVVGSIAGDDTVMCAIASVDETLIVMNKLRKLLDK